ncbi:MAG: hypothetical protein JW751_14455 [Polyangiaceae bacterium]|nr:hypothetical protein [Polyangiaceae bacterium]
MATRSFVVSGLLLTVPSVFVACGGDGHADGPGPSSAGVGAVAGTPGANGGVGGPSSNVGAAGTPNHAGTAGEGGVSPVAQGGAPWGLAGSHQGGGGAGKAGESSGGAAGEHGDLDADGTENGADNCPETKNPEQTDADDDGVGDACQAIPGFEPAIDVVVEDPEATSFGVTLLSIMGVDTFADPDFAGFGYLAALPMAPSRWSGSVVAPLWVYADFSGGPFTDVDLLPGGHLLAVRGIDGGDRAVEIDPKAGETVSSYHGSMVNHGVQRLEDGTLLFIYSTLIEHDTYGIDVDDDGIRETRMDGLRVIDEDENVVWEWSLLDHDIDLTSPPSLTYATFTSYWSNCNALSFLADAGWEPGSRLTGDVYLTCRLMDRLYKIAYPEGTIEWVMGRGGDFGEGLFHHPHDPQIEHIEDGDGNRAGTRILLYDNREAPLLGDAEPCPPDETCPDGIEPYSRVIEVVVDEALDAALVWKWPSPTAPDFDAVKVYSPLAGGVQVLPNGNLLVTHATDGGNPYLGDPVRARVDEVRRDGTLTGGEVVWSARLSTGYATFKALRIPTSAADGWSSRAATSAP